MKKIQNVLILIEVVLLLLVSGEYEFGYTWLHLTVFVAFCLNTYLLMRLVK